MIRPNPTGDLRARSLRGGAWAAAGAAGASLAGLVSFLVLSRILGPEAYGLLAMIEVTLAFSQRLMTSGLSEPLIQMPEIRDEHADTLFWSLQLTALLLIAATLALSSFAGGFFHQSALPPLLRAASLALYFQATGLVPAALLARRFGFRDTATASVASEFAAGFTGITAALSGAGPWALVLQRITASAVQAGVLLVQARYRPQWRFSRAALADVWQFSASRGLDGMLGFLDQQVPRIVLGRVAGAVELGYFIFARRIAENTVQLFNAPIRVAAISTFAAIQTDLDRVRRTYAEGTALTASAILPASAGIALVAPYLVLLLAGPDWQPSVVLLQLLVIASIRQVFHVWNGALLRGLGRPALLLAASITRTIVLLVLIPIFLPWGAPGICVSILAAAFLSWPVAMVFVRKVSGMGVAWQLRSGRGPFLSTLLMAGAVLAFQHNAGARLDPLPALVLSVLIGAVIYAAAMSLLGRRELASLRHNFSTLLGGAGTPKRVK